MEASFDGSMDRREILRIELEVLRINVVILMKPSPRCMKKPALTG